MIRSPEIRVLATAEAAVPVLLEELRAVMSAEGRPLVSFATGSTFSAMLRALGSEFQSGGIGNDFVATHLDEYLGFPPERRGGMVQELVTQCPPLGEKLRSGTFLPVPHQEDGDAIEAHSLRLQRAGGVALQFLGIGRNGHIAFNEPGTSFEVGFHATDLAEATRRDAQSRFRPDEPPRRAVTSGIATIFAAERLVLCAFSAAKADAVRAMLQGDVTPACPASALRRHPNLLVMLDREAAAGLAASVGRASAAP